MRPPLFSIERKSYGLSAVGGLPRSIQNFAYNQVGFKRRKAAVIVDLTSDYRSEVTQRIVIRGVEFGRFLFSRFLPGAVNNRPVAQHGGNFAGAPINLHVFDGEWPVPGRLQD